MGKHRKELYLRAAEASDMMLLYRWVNDPAVRASAFRSELISLEEHKAWFWEALQKPDVKIFILMDGEEAVGQIRLNIENGEQAIDYSVAADQRGKGYGREMLSLLETVCCRAKPLVGRVKPNNIASNHAFQRLGYESFREEDCYIYRKQFVRTGE